MDAGIILLCLFGAFVALVAYIAIEVAHRLTDFDND